MGDTDHLLDLNAFGKPGLLAYLPFFGEKDFRLSAVNEAMNKKTRMN